MKKTFCAILLLGFLAVFSALPAEAVPSKKKAVQGNSFPSGWQYEAGYTYWRMQKGLPANRTTYKRYRRDRLWHNKMHNRYRTGEVVLDALDWTVIEGVKLLERNEDWLKFHPAGLESEY